MEVGVCIASSDADNIQAPVRLLWNAGHETERIARWRFDPPSCFSRIYAL